MGSLGGRKAEPKLRLACFARGLAGGSRGPRFLLAWGRGLRVLVGWKSHGASPPSRSSVAEFHRRRRRVPHPRRLPPSCAWPPRAWPREDDASRFSPRGEVTSLHPLELRLGQQVSAVMENRPQRVGKRVDFVPSLPSLLLLLKPRALAAFSASSLCLCAWPPAHAWPRAPQRPSPLLLNARKLAFSLSKSSRPNRPLLRYPSSLSISASMLDLGPPPHVRFPGHPLPTLRSPRIFFLRKCFPSEAGGRRLSHNGNTMFGYKTDRG